ncbi:MAG TPA: flagellar motor switch protein FliG [Spirochaetota bacterium]|nr:flagellar motor switch protein FliG [Spirochaetota bacterium]HOD15663.1 flagellar motor switch protein FliG [Spirochaetota bacterium]HPG51486.1 flagellar motor switch protein FliG [Spirochaetota bacterium]HPN13726.1 flagellar motor switch protein FliG [Spirochaetota bacterium]HQL81225.1 flagellar motor switch protein FliG [Spirochaetota bacterium]
MKDIFDMSGVERAAALLVALGPKVAAEIMKHLDEESIEKLTAAIAKIDRLSPVEREELIGEFLIDLRKEKRRLRGGQETARAILTKTYGETRADEILRKCENIDVDKEFAALNEIEDAALIAFLKDEHPQTIAVAMSFLAPEKAAAVMKSLSPEATKETALRMARMDRVMPEAVAGIVRTIKKKYQEYRQKNQGLSAGGLDTLIGILRHMPGDDEKKIVEDLEIEMPSVSEQIRDKIFAFENAAHLTNNEMRILIDEIGDDRLIATALKGAEDDVRFKFLRNMSQNRATDILSDMNAMGAVRRSEVNDSRNKIVAIMRNLDDNGIIDLKGGDELVK